MTDKKIKKNYLTGRILVELPLSSTPNNTKDIFHKSVIFIYQHDRKGAKGLILNKLEGINLEQLLLQAGIMVESGFVETILSTGTTSITNKNLYFDNYYSKKRSLNPKIIKGGPLLNNNGFILHDNLYDDKTTLKINSTYGLTCTLEILKEIAQDKIVNFVVTLGECQWKEGQLEKEIINNHWLCLTAKKEIVFSKSIDTMWNKALNLNNIDVSNLSTLTGNI